jgi:hypothetical protein
MARGRKTKAEGLGDTVETILETTGVKKLVQIFVDGKDCGCEERKQKLNELFPYRFKARCLTEEEYNKMYSLRDSLQKLSGAIHLDIKCNSTQSRLQCSFNRFQQFVEKNPAKLVAKSNTNEFRGGTISSQITSSRRVFKKKQNV